jgi:IS605 OrfB family transposase
MLHQLSGSLARTKSVFVLEDLHVRGMQQNRRLALSISDASMGELRRQLAYKSEWHGSTLLVAGRFWPSSKLCSSCGVIKPALALGERTFDCDACGVALDRDLNAAINLRAYRLNQLGIVPLPADRREVTPDGEEGSGAGTTGAKPASLKQEASRRRTRRPNTRSEPKDSLVSVSSRESNPDANPHFRSRSAARASNRRRCGSRSAPRSRACRRRRARFRAATWRSSRSTSSG